MGFGVSGMASAANGDVMVALGIDWKLLAFQVIAFLILVALLKKFVFPVFIGIVDKRQAAIEESNRAAVDAGKQAEKAQSEVAKMLKQARQEAASIVGMAKDEATDLLQRAESKSKAHSEAIVEAAKSDIQKEVVAAKKALHNQTVELVAAATEKIIGQKMDASSDQALIKKALEDA